MDIELDSKLSCTFPPGDRLISVVLSWSNRRAVVRKFKLYPEALTKVSMFTTPQNTEISVKVSMVRTQNER